MRSILPWVVAVVVSLVLSAALYTTNQRIAALEQQLGDVNNNYIQLSVPVEETVRDISAIYSEIDALRNIVPATEQLPAPSRRQPVTPQQTKVFSAPDYYPKASERIRVGEQIDMAAAANMTNEQRQQLLQRKNGVFNDFDPDEEDEN